MQLQLRSVRSKLLAAEMAQRNLTAQLSMLQNGTAPDLEAAVEEAKAHADLLRSHILPALSHSLASRALVWEYVWLHGDLLPPGTSRTTAGVFMLCFLVVAWVAVGGTVTSMVQAMQAVQLLPESLLNALHLESSTALLSLERQLGRLRGKATSNSPGTATPANVSTAQQHTFLRSPESRQGAAVGPPPERGTEEAKRSTGKCTCCCAGQNKTLLLRQRCALVACIIVPPTLLAAAVLAVHLIAASANTVALQETSARSLLLQVLSTAPVACHWAALAAISGFREAAAQELTDVEDAAFDGMDTLSAGAASPVQGLWLGSPLQPLPDQSEAARLLLRDACLRKPTWQATRSCPGAVSGIASSEGVRGVLLALFETLQGATEGGSAGASAALAAKASMLEKEVIRDALLATHASLERGMYTARQLYISLSIVCGITIGLLGPLLVLSQWSMLRKETHRLLAARCVLLQVQDEAQAPSTFARAKAGIFAAHAQQAVAAGSGGSIL